MKLRLERTYCGPKCSIGSLYVDDVFECYTLEDVERGTDPATVAEWKVHGKTAIPKGSYNVVVTRSNRFKRDLPLIEDVPGFSGIRIHPGNTPEDTEGCILVGRTKGRDWIGESRVAFADLFVEINGAIASGDTVSLEIASSIEDDEGVR